MMQRVQVVALAISVAIGAALVTGLTLGSREAPVHVGPTAASASDQVAIYAAVLVNLAGAGSPGALRPITVSQTIYDTCPERPPVAPPKGALCGRTKVGPLKPDIAAALHEALLQQGVDATFVDDGDFSLHQIVTEATGTPAADGDVNHHANTKFHFKKIQGQWQVQAATVEWMAD